MAAHKMAELVITKTGERLQRRVVEEGVNAVYVAVGGSQRAGFFVKNGRPVPSNPHKHLELKLVYWEGR